MKKITTIAIAMLLATSVVSPSNAENWIKNEKPCGSKCPPVGAPQPLFPNGSTMVSYPNGLPANVEISGPRPEGGYVTVPTYQGSSQTIIRSRIGNTTSSSLINSTYQSYRREYYRFR
jgi:hypothetical protein